MKNLYCSRRLTIVLSFSMADVNGIKSWVAQYKYSKPYSTGRHVSATGAVKFSRCSVPLI